MGLLALVVASLVSPRAAPAQAWLPSPGETTVSLSWYSTFNELHVLEGEEIDLGHTRANSFAFEVDYAVGDRLALGMGIPYVNSKYYGPFPHEEEGVHVDDGRYHGTFQDLRFELRYQALRDPVVLTPFVTAAFPSHEYVFYAHSAAGRRVDEYALGVYLGRSFEPFLPGAYVHGRLAYTRPERVLGIHPDRGNADLELGYFVTTSLGMSLLARWQEIHGGWSFSELPPLDDPRFFHHDRVHRDDFVQLGAGLSYQVSDRLGLFGAYLTSVRHTEGHKLKHGITLGLSTRLTRGRLLAAASE